MNETHALVYGFASSFLALLTSLLTAYFLTLSSLPNLKNDLILVALFRPNRIGSTLSVNPRISASPCFTIHHDQTQHGDIGANDTPSDGLALALAGAVGAVAGVSVGEEADTLWEEDAFFMRKPCWSLPPVIPNMYPFHSSPRKSLGSSWEISLS